MNPKTYTRYTSAAAIVCLGLLLRLVLCVLWQRSYYWPHVQKEFTHRAATLSNVLCSAITQSLEVLEYTEVLSNTKREIERSDFDIVAAHELREHPAIQAFA
jgi:hypothetical protein